jgi:hypothetical protein
MPWEPPNHRRKYGLSGSGSDRSSMPTVAGPSTDFATAATLHHPDGPLLWFGLLTGVTFGLMAFSGHGSIRIWKFRASGSASAGDNDGK